MRRPAVLGLLLAILAVACGSTPPTPTPPPADGLTAWDRALAATDDDGSFTKDQALTLFATAFGPLPGVDVAQDLAGIHDQTPAVLAVLRYRDELTKEQQAAIDRYLAPSPDAVEVRIPPVAATGPFRLAAAVSDTMKVRIEELAIEYRARLAQRLGFDIDGDVLFSIEQSTGDGLWGRAGGYDNAMGRECRITVYSKIVEGDPVNLRATVAHELFHCFQMEGYGSEFATALVGRWIVEGQAAYVEADLARDAMDSFWKDYLTQARKPLTARVYDAVGFYAHLAESGIDPWTTFDDMWTAKENNLEAFRAAGADNPRFLQSWASGLVREPIRGLPWDATGPVITADRYAPRPTPVRGGSDIVLSAPFFTNDVLALSVDADLLHVQLDGDGRLSDGTHDTTGLADAWFCIAGHDCAKRCAGKPAPPTTQATIQPNAYLAITGGIGGAVGHARGVDLDECESPTPDPDAQLCSSCGKALGDVHLVTVGGERYDFQGVGEFVMLRSTDGSFEVQARMQPYGTSRTVSIVTAVGARVGGRRVAIYSDVAHDTFRVAIDGQDVPTDAGVDLDGGNRLVPDAGGVRLELADGGYLAIVNLPGYGLNLVSRPPEAALPGIGGLMGPKAPGSDLPALADGTALPTAPDRHHAYVDLYRTFAPSWRVTQAGSLFDHEPGTSTETYTDADFPLADELRTLDELTPEERAAGEAACRDTADETLHAMCVYDVGITADAGFGAGYVKTAQLLTGGTVTASGELVRVVNLYANADGPVALDVYAWAGAPTTAEQGKATRVGTVAYGSAGAFFDPGTLAGNTGSPVSRVSIQRAGEPLNPFQFNLVDVERPSDPGIVGTMLIRDGDAADISIVGGRAAAMDELYEAATTDHPGPHDAPAGKALLFADIDPLYYDRPGSELFLGAGSGCLAYPDFPTVPVKLAGRTGAAPLVVEPGDRQVTVHDAVGGPDPAPACTTPSAVPPIPLDAAVGGRSYLFVYVTPGDPTLRTLLVPFRS